MREEVEEECGEMRKRLYKSQKGTRNEAEIEK